MGSWVGTSTVLACAAALATAACSKDKSSGAARTAPSAAASPAAGQKRFAISGGTTTFLIDAPEEKIKGRSTKMRGSLDVDPENLKASRGQIEVDLDDLRTETFDDAAKNQRQTEHTKNWLEIGSDVEPKRREENRWARFTIASSADTSSILPPKSDLLVHKRNGRSKGRICRIHR